MRSSDLKVLVDYHYWATRRVLDAGARLTDEEFRQDPCGTTRSLRGTLVHALDVEWSWRQRLRGVQGEGSETELTPEDFPTVADLAERWSRDEADMRAWFGTLTDEQLAAPPAVRREIRAPLWFFVMHILTHGTLQRADAAALLTQAGHSPGDLDFLDFVDAMAPQGGLTAADDPASPSPETSP